MTVFTRTSAGIANYSKFHGTDFTVFIEGRADDPKNNTGRDPPDVHFYTAVLKSASNGKAAKIKCVGNRASVFEYARKIETGLIRNAIVIVDKDLDGILSSPVFTSGVIRTHGYSWENELWSVYTLTSLLGQLTNQNAQAIMRLGLTLPKMERRLKYLSAIDAACQVDGFAVLKKSSSFCGVGLKFTASNPVPFIEIARLSAIFKKSNASKCSISRTILKAALKLTGQEIIQGHFWSNASSRLLGHICHSTLKEAAPSNNILLNLALAILRENPEAAIGTNIFNRYQAELMRVGV